MEREASEESFEGLSRLGFKSMFEKATKVVAFINEARLLAEPELLNHDVMYGSTFDAFWRTLLYNRTQFTSTHGNGPPDKNIGISFGYWYLMMKLISTKIRWVEDPLLVVRYWMFLHPLTKPFSSLFNQLYGNRAFCVSETGRIGWAPSNTKPGDSLMMFQGAGIPSVVRRKGEDLWEIIGSCYIHECMDGQIWKTQPLEWDLTKFV